MSLRPVIVRLIICLSFVLASTYVQAMSHVDDMRSVVHAGVVKAKLPPCHQAKKDGKSDNGGQHHGCCSNFACSVGIIIEADLRLPLRMPSVHDVDYGTSGRSAVDGPLNPPPKTV